jgi:hypothetical protein
MRYLRKFTPAQAHFRMRAGRKLRKRQKFDLSAYLGSTSSWGRLLAFYRLGLTSGMLWVHVTGKERLFLPSMECLFAFFVFCAFGHNEYQLCGTESSKKSSF